MPIEKVGINNTVLMKSIIVRVKAAIRSGH